MTSKADYQVLLETIVTAAKASAIEAGGKQDQESRAYLFAYCDILDSVKTQAEVLGVPLSEIGLEGFDPYQLTAGKKAA
ncbi:MAG: hypothetical protein EPN17_00955 [Methylobacter sp.]|nr:MAG: hypothetical protein EPN17_00955 [Methylobacter sp.]